MVLCFREVNMSMIWGVPKCCFFCSSDFQLVIFTVPCELTLLLCYRQIYFAYAFPVKKIYLFLFCFLICLFVYCLCLAKMTWPTSHLLVGISTVKQNWAKFHSSLWLFYLNTWGNGGSGCYSVTSLECQTCSLDKQMIQIQMTPFSH